MLTFLSFLNFNSFNCMGGDGFQVVKGIWYVDFDDFCNTPKVAFDKVDFKIMVYHPSEVIDGFKPMSKYFYTKYKELCIGERPSRKDYKTFKTSLILAPCYFYEFDEQPCVRKSGKVVQDLYDNWSMIAVNSFLKEEKQNRVRTNLMLKQYRDEYIFVLVTIMPESVIKKALKKVNMECVFDIVICKFPSDVGNYLELRDDPCYNEILVKFENYTDHCAVPSKNMVYTYEK